MWLIVIAVFGICAGILLGSARVPRIQAAPLLSALGVIVVGGLPLAFSSAQPVAAGIILVVAVLASSSARAAMLWRRLGTRPGRRLREWMWLDVLSPARLRREDASRREE